MSRRDIKLPSGRSVSYGLDFVTGYFGQLWPAQGETIWLCVNCLRPYPNHAESPCECGYSQASEEQPEGPIDTTPMVGSVSKSVLLEWFDKHGITRFIPKADLHAIALDIDIP